MPRKSFKCKRGVRQRDALSPLLFVLAAELLQILINKAAEQNLLKAPIPQPDEDFPIVQYADDTLFFLENDSRVALNLKWIRTCFEQIFGMRINYHKSALVPINMVAS